MNKCLIGGAEGGALVICLFSVICYRACENRLQYIQIYIYIQSPHLYREGFEDCT